MSEGPQIKVDALDATERTTLQNTITWLLTYPTAQWESSRGYPEIETCMSYGLVSMLGRLLSNVCFLCPPLRNYVAPLC